MVKDLQFISQGGGDCSRDERTHPDRLINADNNQHNIMSQGRSSIRLMVRTHDPEIKSFILYRLSYPGFFTKGRKRMREKEREKRDQL